MDIAQHLTWVNGMRQSLVIPNYHMPAVTVPGFFSPLMALVGQATKLGIDGSAAYAAAEVLFGILSVYCILICLRHFLESRRQIAGAVIIMLGGIPLVLSLNVWHALRGEESGTPNFFLGDGLFVNGALGTTLGTACVYASLILVTRYLISGRRRYLYWTGAVAVLSGLGHPFEVFTIAGATVLTLIVLRWPSLRTAFKESMVVVVPAILGVLPYVYFSLKIPWMRHVAEQNKYPVPDLLHLLGMLGIPVAFVLFNLIIGPRLRSTSDVVLQCWFAATLVVLHIPKLPFVAHMADGLGLVTAMLAVRQITGVPYLRNWVALRPRLALAVAALVLAPAIFAQVGMRCLLFRSGLQIHNPFGMSALSSQPEYDLIRWFRHNASVHDLVIAPGFETSFMLATAPVHTIASHYLFSGTYDVQSGLRDSFYRGDWTDRASLDFLQTRGINYVVVPEGSPVHRFLGAYPKAAVFPPFTLYHLAGNHMPDRLPEP